MDQRARLIASIANLVKIVEEIDEDELHPIVTNPRIGPQQKCTGTIVHSEFEYCPVHDFGAGSAAVKAIEEAKRHEFKSQWSINSPDKKVQMEPLCDFHVDQVAQCGACGPQDGDDGVEPRIGEADEKYMTLCTPCVILLNGPQHKRNISNPQCDFGTEICDSCNEERSCSNYWVSGKP